MSANDAEPDQTAPWQQPNAGPQRSTEMAMTTQQTQKTDDLNVSDAPRVKGFIPYQIETR